MGAAQRFFSDWVAESDPSRERLWVAHIDGAGRCVHLTSHDGDESGADFPLRAIVADTVVHGSAGILLAHNHPSGDPAPSEADCRATRQLAATVQPLSCTVVDHFIFGGARWSSLRAMGLL